MRKYLLVLFWLPCFLAAFPQQSDQLSTAVLVTELPPKGVALNKDWKFVVGDSSAYAAPGFDDANWKDIDPAQEIHDLPQMRKAGVAWLRITLNIGATVQNKPLAFVLNQIGASEIYLNRRLLQRFGFISAKLKT